MPLNKALRRLYKSIALVVTMGKRGAGGVGGKAKRASDVSPDLPPPFDVRTGAAAESMAAAAAFLTVPLADSTSPSPLSLGEVQQYLAPSPSNTSAALPNGSAALPDGLEEVEVQLSCTTYNCAGGSWSGHDFELCDKRPAFQQHRHHARGVVCVIHHRFIKCASCSLHIHEGCWVKSSNGYTQPKRDVPWTCQQCTLKSDVDPKVKSETPNTEEASAKCTLPLASSASAGDQGATCQTSKCTPTLTSSASAGDQGATCHSFFSNRQTMLAHMRDQGWAVKSNEDNRIYFTCTKCSRRIKTKAQTDDVANGEWTAVNMPSSHDCHRHKPVATCVTSRVCHLPNAVFMEIQRLACSKAFNTVSIQSFIKAQYAILVNTSLIYNIGYRARQKLGISDMEKLILQREVCVYVTQALTLQINTNYRHDGRSATPMKWCLTRETMVPRV
jgi:hypothetical protein